MIIATVTTDSGAILPLGRQGEHGVRQVRFDLSYLIGTFGEGTAILVHQRSQDLAPYIVSAVQDGDRLEWTVTDVDTAYKGFGKAEIRWTVGDDLAKTVTYKTSVQRSLTEQTEIPEPLESWYDTMIVYIDQLKVDSDARLAEAVENASQSATSATESAASATESATSAAESETTATAKAEQATQSAANAAQSATNAATSAAESAASADKAEQAAANSGYMYFHIDSSGDLIYRRTSNVDVTFYLADGDLYVR